ncbi:hemolysin III family protein [Marinobacteraceae bacterium S3BR75-40.1]
MSENEREQTIVEEVVNALTHGLGAVLSIAAVAVLITLVSLEADPWKIVSVSIYGLSLILVYLSSTLYHGVQHPTAKKWLNLFDHCAIYLLIAGTYTPFLLVNMRGWLGWTLFVVVWGLGLAGIFLKIRYPGQWKRWHLVNYLLMGWLLVFTFPVISDYLSTSAVNLMIAGGLTYSVGVIFFLLTQIRFSHAVWHLFVIGGSVCHYIAVFQGVV